MTCGIGWSQPGFFNNSEDEMALHSTIFHVSEVVLMFKAKMNVTQRLIDLISSTTASFFVPMLYIGIAQR